jgi:putative nucleotidyltransferase with HDIG domain
LNQVRSDIQAQDGTPPKAMGQILLADDDAQTCAAMSYVLKHLGYEVTAVNNGRDLLKLATELSYDLALVDVRMPVLDGLTTLAALKRNPTTMHMPVILMTKYNSSEVVAKCRDLGAVDFLSKGDLKLDVLKEKIVRAMGYDRPKLPAKPTKLPPMSDDQASDSPAGQMGQTDPWLQAASSIAACTATETRDAVGQSQLYLIFEQIKQEIAQLTTDQIKQCSQLVEMDPGATCSVLQFANAGEDPSLDKVLSVRHAVESLSVSTIQKIIENMPSRPNDPITTPWVIHWWRHAIATAHLAAAIGPHVGIDADEARVMGLLHDVGRLQLINSEIGHSVVRTYDVARNVVLPMTSCEQIMLGMDHLELGAEFCELHGLPQATSMACITHELTNALRDRLDSVDAARSAMLCAADQIANAAGFHSLPGIDLRPLPATARDFLPPAHTAIEQALTQASADMHWWLGKDVPQFCHAKVDITGINIVMISSYNNHWNPFRRALTLAGGNVLAFSHLQQVTEHVTRPDVVLIDQTATTIHSDVEHLQCITRHFGKTPMLLLAQRSDEPEMLIQQLALPIHVYSSPIRANSLLQAIRKLVASSTGGQSQ